MSKEYPYLVAGLPELLFDGDAKAFSLDELVAYVHERIDVSDKRLLRLLLLGLKEKTQTPVFYSEAAKCNNKFINNYFAFDRDCRNVLAGAAARRMGVSAQPHLVGDGEVTEAILYNKAADFGLSGVLDFMPVLSSILDIENVLERERKLDQLRWSKAEELTVFNYIDIDKVLAFVAKAHIVARWLKLDKPKGEEFFEKLVLDIKGSYTK